MKQKYLVLVCAVLLTGCSDSDYEAPSSSGSTGSSSSSAPMLAGKFSSMSECISTIEKHTHLKINPMTDEPNHVSGFLGETNRNFNCELKETGSQGTYVDGWFDK